MYLYDTFFGGRSFEDFKTKRFKKEFLRKRDEDLFKIFQKSAYIFFERSF
jgi:hypothetical protein